MGRLRRHLITVSGYARQDSKEGPVVLVMLKRPRSMASIVEFMVPNKKLIALWKREKARWRVLRVYSSGLRVKGTQ